MITERDALNLVPGDEIELAGGTWWTVTKHVFRRDERLPIELHLVSLDRYFSQTLYPSITDLFRCKPACI